MTSAVEAPIVSEHLERRRAVERRAESTGRTFRRHPERQLLEKYLVKPVLREFLKMTTLYEQGMKNALAPVITRLQLDCPDLPERISRFRILQLSDLHIDSVPGLADVVARTVSRINADLCVLTGDYRFLAEGPCDDAIAGMKQVFRAIRSGHQPLAILGNHDPCEMAPALEQMGARVLLNDAAEIRLRGSSLWFLGVDDSYDYRCDDLDAALSKVPLGAFQILLAHTPDLYAEAAAADVKLYLCGHTHAGQIRLPRIGSLIQNSDAPRGYTHGSWKHGEMDGYTSAGIGCSMLPVRFGCPPEIVVIDLHRAG
jgi:predicted MPP superfamily phosphohydrolase